MVLFGEAVADTICTYLALNVYNVPFKSVGLSFVTGQPLGMHSSWPLFALSHHILMWWCAELVYPGRFFDRYALLGD